MENLARIFAGATVRFTDDCPMMRGFWYSGRGMFGDECVAFNLESLTDMLTFGTLLHEIAEEEHMHLDESLSAGARYDNMGHGFVLYFPRVSWGDYEREFTDMRTGIDGVDPNQEEDCEHDWNVNGYCNKCGTDGQRL